MSQKTDFQQKWVVASYELQDAYTDFILSRQAMLCSSRTIRFYHFTAGRFVKYLETSGVTKPEELSTRYIRAYLGTLVEQNLCDSYIHGHARAIKTLVRFWHAEKYIPEVPKFQMPAIAKKRLPILSAKEVKKALSFCEKNRDKAIIYLLVDTGIRNREFCALDWGHVDLPSGIIRIEKGKGGKARSVVAGIKTRRALLAYRREIEHWEDLPLFQTNQGNRLSSNGLRSLLNRIGKKSQYPYHTTCIEKDFRYPIS